MDILIIITKSAAILTIFYVLYQAILQKDTFYTANRHYLLAGIIAALSIPFIEFTKTVYIDMPVIATAALDTDSFVPMLLETAPEENAFEINWWMVALVIYGVGVGIMIGRLLVQLYSLHSLLKKHPSHTVGNFTYVQIADNIAPFSFFRYICYNPALHTQEELQMIIAHEKVHAGQLHTIDVLLTQIVLAFQWINPLAWFYKKSLEQNLEFLADSGALQAVHSSKAYQYTLVKVSSTALRPALTNQFYHSLIKKRIVMLNKETSRRRNLLKLGAILPLLALFMYSFNVKEVIEYREVKGLEETAFAKANSEISFQEFIVDKTISKAYLTSIENYFKNTFKSTEVRFSNVKFKDKQLASFDFQTKMKDDSRFYTRFSMKAGNKGVSPFTLTPVKEHEILQTYVDGHQVQFTPEGSNTRITIRDNEASMGKDPILVVNGSVIKTSNNKITYETDAGIKIVEPKEAVALYGKAASDGAIVIDDPMYTTKINGKYLKHPAFVINHKTTDTQIEALENYFKENHPDALIDIHEIKRDNKGEIKSYRIRTKFESTPEWQNILSVNSKKSVAQGIQVKYLKNSGIQLQELGPKGIEMRSSSKGLYIDDDALEMEPAALLGGLQLATKSVDSNPFRVKITKDYTKEQLDALVVKLKKEYDVNFSYSNLNFNNAGEITSISIKAVDNVTGNKANNRISSDTPIGTIVISRTSKGSFGVQVGGNAEAAMGVDEWEKVHEKRMQERRKELDERREEATVEREKRREELEAGKEEMRSQMKGRGEEMREEMKARRQELRGKQEEMKKRMKKMRKENDRGYVTLDDTTYYFANINGQTKFFDRYGVAITNDDPLYERLFKQKGANKTQVGANKTKGAKIIKTLTINKNSTDLDIITISNSLIEYGASLNITKVKRNRMGEIIKYRLKFDDGNGSKIVASSGSDEAISPIVISFDQNGTVSLEQ